MNEMDIGKIMHHVQVESGVFRGDDTSIMASLTANLEKEGICDILAEDDVPITKNDYLKIDIQNRHRGYWADIARCYQFGPMTSEVNEIYDLCEEGMRIGESMLKPGIPAKEIHKAASQPIAAAGLPPLSESGHGIGMDIHEPPMLTINNEMLLQEGMVLALEVWAHGSYKRKGGAGVVGIEEQYVITDKGFERIPGFNKSIRQVAHPFS
jgi:Xaa-Pro aminopeptidase